MRLISLSNKDDAERIRAFVAKRFTQYNCSVRETSLGNAVEAEYKGHKNLTNSESNIALVLIPSCAQAFYDGLIQGRNELLNYQSDKQ